MKHVYTKNACLYEIWNGILVLHCTACSKWSLQFVFMSTKRPNHYFFHNPVSILFKSNQPRFEGKWMDGEGGKADVVVVMLYYYYDC